LSVKKIYQSREVIEKELSGYQMINNLLDKFITAYNNQYEGKATNYDKLLLNLLPEKRNVEKESLYERLLHICHFISMLTDGNALLYNKIISG
jgi:dGTPase